MKSALSLTLVASIVMAALPVRAQEATPTPVISPKAESRLPDARLLSRRAGGHVDEVTGVLVSDPQAKQVRFEMGDRAACALPYDRITAMHYEEGNYPKRFLSRSSYYLILHYLDSTGQGAFESVRLLSNRDVAAMLAALEADTGVKIDRAET
jgi:hypothetical protein